MGSMGAVVSSIRAVDDMMGANVSSMGAIMGSQASPARREPS